MSRRLLLAAVLVALLAGCAAPPNLTVTVKHAECADATCAARAVPAAGAVIRVDGSEKGATGEDGKLGVNGLSVATHRVEATWNGETKAQDVGFDRQPVTISFTFT